MTAQDVAHVEQRCPEHGLFHNTLLSMNEGGGEKLYWWTGCVHSNCGFASTTPSPHYPMNPPKPEPSA